MTQDQLPSFLSSLHLPLRDILRGVVEIADRGEETFRKAASALPPELQAPVRSVLAEFESASARILEHALTTDEVDRAARFTAGKPGFMADAACFTRVLAFGWDHIRSKRRDSREIFSETIAATLLMFGSRARRGRAGRTAGHIFEALRFSAAFGRPPGRPVSRHPSAQEQLDLNLLSILVWLLATRADSMAEELPLLDLAAILVVAHSGALQEAMGDPDALARQLESISAHL